MSRAARDLARWMAAAVGVFEPEDCEPGLGIAGRCRIPHGQVKAWLRGEGAPDRAERAQLARGLELQPGERRELKRLCEAVDAGGVR